jgi:squamous cell carcinoma antigen recognized by T-cells 3
VEGNLTLIAKISDPSHKQDRSGAAQEGREIHIVNIHWKASEEDLKQLFEKFGKIKRVRIPTTLAGRSKGFAFVVFASKVIPIQPRYFNSMLI